MSSRTAAISCFAVALVFFVAIAAAKPASAQIACTDCFEGEGSQVYIHGMNGGGAGSGQKKDVDCESDGSCHASPELGGCLEGPHPHDSCLESLVDASTLVQELTTAVSADRTDIIAAYLTREARTLRFNTERKAVQC